MYRDEVIRRLLVGRRNSAYLEIGVNRGDCFFSVRARRKVAVDPLFNFPHRRRWRPREVLSSRFFPMTSDAFFANEAAAFADGFDVIFIDGLHTYRQSLADVEHVLKHVKAHGWIVLHDCNPLSAAAAAAASSYTDAMADKAAGQPRQWCGDVWKTVVQLRSTRSDLAVTVLDCDFGVGLIRRVVPRPAPDLPRDLNVEQLNYSDLETHRRVWLNLAPPDSLDAIIAAAGRASC